MGPFLSCPRQSAFVQCSHPLLHQTHSFGAVKGKEAFIFTAIPLQCSKTATELKSLVTSSPSQLSSVRRNLLRDLCVIRWLIVAYSVPKHATCHQVGTLKSYSVPNCFIRWGPLTPKPAPVPITNKIHSMSTTHAILRTHPTPSLWPCPSVPTVFLAPWIFSRLHRDLHVCHQLTGQKAVVSGQTQPVGQETSWQEWLCLQKQVGPWLTSKLEVKTHITLLLHSAKALVVPRGLNVNASWGGGATAARHLQGRVYHKAVFVFCPCSRKFSSQLICQCICRCQPGCWNCKWNALYSWRWMGKHWSPAESWKLQHMASAPMSIGSTVVAFNNNHP